MGVCPMDRNGCLCPMGGQGALCYARGALLWTIETHSPSSRFVEVFFPPKAIFIHLASSYCERCPPQCQKRLHAYYIGTGTLLHAIGILLSNINDFIRGRGRNSTPGAQLSGMGAPSGLAMAPASLFIPGHFLNTSLTKQKLI